MTPDRTQDDFGPPKQLNQQKKSARQCNPVTPIICRKSRRSGVKICLSKWRRLNDLKSVARPAGLEPATTCLGVTQYKTLSAASGVAYEETRHLSRP